MKRTFTTVLVFLSITGFTFATEKETPGSVEMTASVQGTVTDKVNGEVLAGVAVKLAGTDIVVYSDFDGNFQFTDLKPGKYQIDSDMISYKKNSEVVKVDPKKENKVELEMENL